MELCNFNAKTVTIYSEKSVLNVYLEYFVYFFLHFFTQKIKLTRKLRKKRKKQRLNNSKLEYNELIDFPAVFII